MTGAERHRDRSALRLVCISDTHGEHERVALPPGDVLVHAGDVTAHGSELDWLRFLDWFGSRDFAHRLFVAGNHDRFPEARPERARRLALEAGVTWLDDEGCRVEGVVFWGSPITPRFHDWSFMRDPGPDIERHWAMIPEGTDVLVTHGPPAGILDEVERADGSRERTGCPSLLERIATVRPALHLFGHIHEGYGRLDRGGVSHVNVSTMDSGYRIANAPVALELSGIGHRTVVHHGRATDEGDRPEASPMRGESR